ncbi:MULTISPECIES: phosphoribosyltransferase domain-containing protein [Streptomyces]|uniref:Phosphoribosyltransferase n=1 Tax=Streptomyces luteosporeus TaxID=173856 RepID=A0ABP6G646_9ACTN
MNGVWSGQWVADRLGIELRGDTARLRDLLGLALRRNPKRAHLLVSHVLGKHVPVSPARVYGAGLDLGRRVRAVLGEADAARAVVLGYAETATGLGHCVADGLGPAPYLHSTRRAVRGIEPVGGFEEEHSHATSHLLLPEDDGFFAGDGPLVLVDDEFSTGRTVRNTIAALHTRFPRGRYVVAALVDVRSAQDRAALDAFAAELGARVDVVALATGTVHLPHDVLERGAALVREAPSPSAGAALRHDCPQTRVDLQWPSSVPDGARHGFTPAHHAALEAALPEMAAQLVRRVVGSRSAGAERVGTTRPVDGDGAQPPRRDAAPAHEPAPGDGAQPPLREPHRILILGTEELMYAPLRLAHELERQLAGEKGAKGANGATVAYSTTTRSPVHPVDDPGYAIRSRITFRTREGERYVHNVAGAGFDTVVVVADDVTDTTDLLAQLAAHAQHVALAVIPSYIPPKARIPMPEPLRGPAFSSYAPEEVGWLLQDLSSVELEAPTEEREEAIQSGGAHYAESLPVEYQPSARYQELYHAALEASAQRLALAVGTVTETVLAERSPRPVLVSLARAGTPVGVLMRRWARHAHDLDVPHYAVSIVRGRGIDPNALRWLAAHHDPADVVFVDGWTGKGAITRELADALRDFPGFDPRLAVLADPGHCVETYGTRDDFLIPSACLNSTVSGLISRTVLRADLVGPHDFHGAKFYRELADADVSRSFLDAVAARFPGLEEDVALAVKELAAADRTPTWVGWEAVGRISEEFGIHDVNLVKPGVGETTRVLLRRVPWKILAKRGAGADLDHVQLLAAQRGVPVEEVDGLPYSCVGLIHPRYTRGATGADGRSVTAP